MTDVDVPPEVLSAVRASASPDARLALERRAREQARQVRRDARAGRLDNRDAAVGLELELYAVDADGRPTPIPGIALDAAGCGPEIGAHNAELNTAPSVLSPAGLERQATQLRDTLGALETALSGAGGVGGHAPPVDVVPAATPATPLAGDTASYLETVTERGGFTFAANARGYARYYAIDNAVLRRAGGSIPLPVADGERRFPTVMPVSLTASIQPHVQVPDAKALPRYLAYATRTMGPLLALTANSPLLPVDLYGDVDPERALAGPHEHRIRTFERTVNAGADPGNVRVPEDHADLDAVLDAILEDPTYAPFLSPPAQGTDRYPERYPELAHKRSTHWRWVRGVFGGSTPDDSDGPAPGNDDASVRVEYRPLPTQPTVHDTVACQATVAGLLCGLDAADHPLTELPRERAAESFYAAARDGPDADLAWVLPDGTATTERRAVYEDLFAHARRGLREHGFDDAAADRWLAPLEHRAEAATSPSAWTKRRVRERLDAGEGFETAVRSVEREYRDRSREGVTFADWD